MKPLRLLASNRRVCGRREMPNAPLMDQLASVLPNRASKKPPLALVMASIVLAVGLWFVIYAVSGRVIWFW